ncbi:shikimate kinase [Wansuia hejianensis]|uniref:Shikimate kinase n=1 Tax=Wansuia hejianensis TaxID=2763667 RepID=A0A926F0K3_9FIRM|nr:shikimate kinase [Wansuia hejianensis]MBC8589759.1 shikimate kinase [Wansuia hejianensis]
MTRLEQDICLIGMPGSGKSTIGKLLGQRFKVSFYDIDRYIEKKHQKKVSEIYKESEENFRVIEKIAIKEIINLSPRIISTGGGTVKSDSSMTLLKKDRLILFINRPIEEIKDEIDINRPIFSNDSTRIYKLYEERYPLYKRYSDIEIINSGDINLVIKKIINKVNYNLGV